MSIIDISKINVIHVMVKFSNLFTILYLGIINLLSSLIHCISTYELNELRALKLMNIPIYT